MNSISLPIILHICRPLYLLYIYYIETCGFLKKKNETVYGFEDGVCNFFVAWLEIRTVLIRIPCQTFL